MKPCRASDADNSFNSSGLPPVRPPPWLGFRDDGGLARDPDLLAFAQQVRAQRDDALTLLEGAGYARAVVTQALDRDGPPGHFCRLTLDDPDARPLAGIEQRGNGY